MRLAYSRKLAVRTLLTVALGVTVYSCATGYQVSETRPSTAVSTEVSETHPSTATSTEIVKVTSAEITQVTDATLREKAISSLPGDKPEAEGGDGSIEVFDANVGGTHFKLYMYKMSQQAIADSKTIEITNNNTVFELKNQVAVYADFINYTGFVAPVRLVGVSTPEVDENGNLTGKTNNIWYYDPGFNPAVGGVVDTSRPVFGYKSDGTNITFDPDSLMTPNIQIDGYTPDPLGGLSVVFDKNNYPNVFDANAITNEGTKTLIPGKEKDLRPAYTETAEGKYMGVAINAELITDKSLDPYVTKVTVNENTYLEFVARTFFKTWLKKGEEPSFDTSEKHFKEFMALWAKAQKTNDPEDWKKVQLNDIWANDLNDGNGYVQKPYIIWPMYSGTDVDGVVGISKFSIALVDAPKMNNITLFTDNSDNVGMGTNLDDGNLVIYTGLFSGFNNNQDISASMADAVLWIKLNSGTQIYDHMGGGRDMTMMFLLLKSIKATAQPQ